MFIDVKLIVVGVFLGYMAKEGGGNMLHNIHVYEFLGRDLGVDIFIPSYLQDWSTVDVREALKPRLSQTGEASCIYAIPVKPLFQITTSLQTGDVCCSIENGEYSAPFISTDSYIEYFCGSYPNQQIVRVMKE